MDGFDDDTSPDDAMPAPAAGSCRTFSDGTLQGAGGFCWFWLILMILLFLGNASWAMQRGATVDKSKRMQYYFVSLLSLIIGALNIFIFYHFLKRCECWTGFWITLAIGLVSSAIFYVVAPGYVELNAWPSEDDWQQLKEAFMLQKQQKKGK